MSELFEKFSLNGQGRTVLVIAPESAGLGVVFRPGGHAESRSLSSPRDLGPAHEGRFYDIVLVDDVLYELTPTEVYDAFSWIQRHLRPGGECLVRTRTWLGPDGGNLGGHVHTPYAHLAFARDAVEEYFEANGWGEPPVANRMCRATYFVLFRRAGLQIVEVELDEHEPQAFRDKLQTYDESELRAAGFRARLRRPEDEEGELAELRALLIGE
jgi:SAM-dependent methyltransferase